MQETWKSHHEQQPDFFTAGLARGSRSTDTPCCQEQSTTHISITNTNTTAQQTMQNRAFHTGRLGQHIQVPAPLHNGYNKHAIGSTMKLRTRPFGKTVVRVQCATSGAEVQRQRDLKTDDLFTKREEDRASMNRHECQTHDWNR